MKTITEFDKQEIYNTVKEHLLKQGERSVNEYGVCAYRGENGLKCSIGCLIPDDMYDPIIESRLVTDRSVIDRLPFYIYHVESGLFLMQLQ